MGQIYHANYTDSPGNYSFQISWQHSTHACGRPPPELDFPVACRLLAGPEDSYFTNRTRGSHAGGSLGAEFKLFAPCCPTHDDARVVTSVYLADEHCDSIWCYTAEENVTAGLGRCVSRLAREKFAEDQEGEGDGGGGNGNGNGNGTAVEAVEYGARCEYIDFDMLKKGKSVAPGFRIGVGAWAVVLGSAAVAFVNQGLM